MIPEAHLALYYAFFKIDFTHSRLSIDALLPLAALTAMFFGRFLPHRLPMPALRWLAVGLSFGVLLWLVREHESEVGGGVGGQIVAWDAAAGKIRLLTIEAVRIATSLLVLVGAIARGFVCRPPKAVLIITGGVLVGFMVLENYTSADFKLNGPQTLSQTVPSSDSFNHLNAAPGELLPAHGRRTRADPRAPGSGRLSRTIVYQDKSRFPASSSRTCRRSGISRAGGGV